MEVFKKAALLGFSTTRMLKLEQTGGGKQSEDGPRNLSSNIGPPSVNYSSFSCKIRNISPS